MNTQTALKSSRAIERLDAVARSIIVVRGLNVMLAADLAEAYGVTVKALNQAVKRNSRRFPPDFAFKVTTQEAAAIQRSRSQIVTLKRGANFKYAPMVFTEHGAVMAATILNSDRAVRMSTYIVRVFLRLREWAVGQMELAQRLSDLNHRVGGHDRDLKAIVATIQQILSPPEPPRRRIGFHTSDKRDARKR